MGAILMHAEVNNRNNQEKRCIRTLNVTAIVVMEEMLMQVKGHSRNNQGMVSSLRALNVTAAAIRKKLLTPAKINSRNHRGRDAYARYT